jgi:hypothetical protein
MQLSLLQRLINPAAVQQHIVTFHFTVEARITCRASAAIATICLMGTGATVPARVVEAGILMTEQHMTAARQQKTILDYWSSSGIYFAIEFVRIKYPSGRLAGCAILATFKLHSVAFTLSRPP